jgi:hypothetical protein
VTSEELIALPSIHFAESEMTCCPIATLCWGNPGSLLIFGLDAGGILDFGFGGGCRF